MRVSHWAHDGFTFMEVVILLVALLLIGLYIGAAVVSSRRSQLRSWPIYRYLCWILGVFCVTITIIGPIAHRAHSDFTFHMIGHLLLGMLAPLLLVLSAPITLLLRTIRVNTARQVSRFLKTNYIRWITEPVVASLLNVGGLWLLYTTDLYRMMHHHLFLHILVHVHVFLAGLVFTASMIYIDPTPHRTSFGYRSTVYVFALAAHEILSKYIYAHPPSGVPSSQAEMGGMWMYYGGDLIDLMIIIIMFYQWYQSRRSLIRSRAKGQLVREG